MNQSRFRWIVAFSATLVVLVASTVLGGDGDPVTDPTWWEWILGRIGVPGG